MTKQVLEHSTKVAAFAVADAHPKGTPLCARELAKQSAVKSRFHDHAHRRREAEVEGRQGFV